MILNIKIPAINQRDFLQDVKTSIETNMILGSRTIYTRRPLKVVAAQLRNANYVSL